MIILEKDESHKNYFKTHIDEKQIIRFFERDKSLFFSRKKREKSVAHAFGIRFLKSRT